MNIWEWGKYKEKNSNVYPMDDVLLLFLSRFFIYAFLMVFCVFWTVCIPARSFWIEFYNVYRRGDCHRFVLWYAKLSIHAKIHVDNVFAWNCGAHTVPDIEQHFRWAHTILCSFVSIFLKSKSSMYNVNEILAWILITANGAFEPIIDAKCDQSTGFFFLLLSISFSVCIPSFVRFARPFRFLFQTNATIRDHLNFL